MQTDPAILAPPLSALILWVVFTIGPLIGVAWLVRLSVRAVRALEKRSTVAEEVLLLSTRIAQQDREIAELRGAVLRLGSPGGSGTRGQHSHS